MTAPVLPANWTPALAVPPPAAGSCMTELMTVVELVLGEKTTTLPTLSPPLEIGLPIVMVVEPGVAPNVTGAAVIALAKVLVPPAAELMMVVGPVKVKPLEPAKL